MQAIALHPKRSQIAGQLVGLALLAFAPLFLHMLCLPAALLLPLFACPLGARKERWFGYAAVLMPALVAYGYGGDALFCLSLLLPGALALAVAAWQQARRTAARKSACFAYIAAYAVALSAIVFFAARAMGGDLSQGLSNELVAAVQRSGNAGELLYRLALAGWISVPSGYQSMGLFPFALDMALRSQLLLSLRLTVRLTLADYVPRLFVETCLVCGLFTSLRVQKLNHAFLLVKKREGRRVEASDVQVARPVGFRMLQLPPQGRALAVGAGIGAIALSLSDSSLAQMLGALCAAGFECVFQLVGAAVLLCQLTARKPERETLYGVIVAAIYLLLPVVPLLLGLLDQALHFRSKSLLHQEEE